MKLEVYNYCKLLTSAVIQYLSEYFRYNDKLLTYFYYSFCFVINVDCHLDFRNYIILQL